RTSRIPRSGGAVDLLRRSVLHPSAPEGACKVRAFVVGGAGFIGSHLVDLLVERGRASSVTVFDNLSVGKREFIAGHLASGKATLVEGDALDLDALTAAMRDHDVCFHLAANP